MPTKGKSLLKKILLVVLILIVVLLIVPFFINVDRYRPEIISELERVTARRVGMKRLSVRFLPKISVVVQDFALGNPPGFPASNFITAQKVSANLEIGPLLHRQIVVESVEIQKPVITLLSKGEQWNFASPAANAIRKASYSIPFQATVGEVVISGADVALGHVLTSGEASPPALEATDAVIDLKSVNLGTTVSPASASPDGASTGIPLRMASLETGGGLPSTNANPVTAHGSLSAKVLRYGQINLTNLKSNLSLDPARLSLNPFSFDAFAGKGAGDFQMNLARANSPYQLSLNLTGIDMAKLMTAFPGGSGKLTGTLNANCIFSGDFAGRLDPWTGKQGDGKLTIVRGRVPNLKLSRNILEMMKIAGLGPTSGDITSFSSISADFELRGGLLSSRMITLLGNGLNANGNGSTDLNRNPDPTLNYMGVARIKAAATPLTSALASLTRIPIHNGLVDLPFRVTGTLNQPKFDVKPPEGIASGFTSAGRRQGAPNSPGNLIQGIIGLFGKTQKPAPKK